MECTYVTNCMNSWEEYNENDAPGLIDKPDPRVSGISNAYWWLAQELAIKFAQGSICSTANASQCNGNMTYAPWRPGMTWNTFMSELSCIPDDAYYDSDRVSKGIGEWVDSDDQTIDWRPCYNEYCEGLYDN
jgi:hypothetical protein